MKYELMFYGGLFIGITLLIYAGMKYRKLEISTVLQDLVGMKKREIATTDATRNGRNTIILQTQKPLEKEVEHKEEMAIELEQTVVMSEEVAATMMMKTEIIEDKTIYIEGTEEVKSEKY